MEPMDVTDGSFRRKSELNDFLDDSSDIELINSSHIDIIQSCQDDAPSEVKLLIHNQCPGIELVSPVYAFSGVTRNPLLNRRVYVGSTTQVGFEINFSCGEPIGILMYELMNKKRSNKDAISSGDEATCTQLVVIWKVNNSKEFYACLRLIEHDKGCVWNRDKLMELIERYILFSIQHDPIENTWLMRDNTVLMTSLNITCETHYKLEMIISKTSIKDDAQRLQYISMNRYVSMTMLVTMFTY
jgi:hypothetical protein